MSRFRGRPTSSTAGCRTTALLIFLFLALGLLTPRGAPAANDWTYTNPLLPGERDAHTATLLPSGQVLVAGGRSFITPHSDCQIYNPASGTWSGTQSLPVGQARWGHTATLLPNGYVLVAGGQSGPNYFGNAYRCLPPGSWWFAGQIIPRSWHTATLLSNGKVLVAGGVNSSGIVASAQLYDPADGTWTDTGDLNVPRYCHTATLLPNGQVLVAGGYGDSYSAELYDPDSGTWSVTGDLTHWRRMHTATLLTNGRVLVSGGEGITLDTAELYNPATGLWTDTFNNLSAGRLWHTATLLPNGKVLVAGGWNNGGLASAEIYDPAANGGAGGWSTANSLNDGRGGHTATLLPNGQVLAVAGEGSGGSAELYEPLTGDWDPATALRDGREKHTAILLPSGYVLAAGGLGLTDTLAHSEFYIPFGDSWVATTGNLHSSRYNHTATLLSSGRVLVTGGEYISGIKSGYRSSTELYDPDTRTWTLARNLGTARSKHTATLLANGQVLMVGGANLDGPLDTAELYNPARGTWTPTGSLTTARSSHTATLLPNGQVLVAGGTGAGGRLASAEFYDPDAGTWKAAGAFSGARSDHTATLLPKGQVLLAGGYNGASYLNSAVLYDYSTNEWSTTGNLPGPRANHTATLLRSGQVLVLGGRSSNSGYLASTAIYNSAFETWSPNRTMATARAYHTATLLATGRVLAAGGYGGGLPLDSAELFNPELPVSVFWVPRINSANESLGYGERLTLEGSLFRGVSEASGGATNDSATDYPLVQFRRIDNERVYWLLPHPQFPFSSTSFTSFNLGVYPNGHYLVTVFANAIPSNSRIIRYGPPHLPSRGTAMMYLLLMD